MSPSARLRHSDDPVILVVDDEIIERVSAAETLRRAGYKAVDVGNVAEAVLALERIDAVRVVLTDLSLQNGLSGIVLAACVDRRWPDVGIIMTSGKIDPLPGDVPSRACFLRKPYCEARMLATVRGMIEHRSRPLTG